MIFGWFNNTLQHLSEEQLSAYVDVRPDAPSEDRVQQHLATCDATCAADLEGLRATVRVLKSIAPVTAPRSFALTTEMVADLPDGKPLGEPPAPVRTGGWRMPVLVPAAASIAAALVFALVLVGNISGAIEQSGSSSADTAVNATGIGGGIDVAVEAEAAVPEMAADPVAGGAAVQKPSAAPAPLAGDSVTMESAAPVTPLRATQAESAFAPPEAAPSLQAEAPVAALAPAPKAEPDTVTLESAPQLESPADAAVDSSGVLDLTQAEFFDSSTAPTASAREDSPVESIAQAAPQLLPGAVPGPAVLEDDDFTLPVWQLLLATGILTALLAAVSLLLSRRNIPG
jgi:hypothetical protein